MSENINIKSDGIINIARGQAVVEARADAPAGCKILSASAWAVTMPGEIFAGEVRYTGKVTFDCLILTGDGAMECVTTVAEFSDKITSPEIAAGMNMTLIPEVINIDTAIESGAVKLIAVIDTSALTVMPREYTCLSVPDDGVYAENRTFEYVSLIAEQTETVYITDSVAVNNVTEVLFASSRVSIGGVETSEGEIKISGTVYTDAVLKGESGASAARVITPFAKSIPALGVTSDSFAYATAAITDTAATYIDGENRLETSATLMLSVTAFDRKMSDCVVDVFCADYEIETKPVTAKLQACEKLAIVTDTVDGQIPIPSEKPAADNVVCISGAFCTLSDTKIDGGRVIAEGLVGGDIVYYNAENNAVDTIAFRLPFSMPLSIHTDMTNVAATATVTDISVRVRRESVFDIKAEVSFALRLSSETECTFIESVKIGEPLPRPDASVIVHIAKPGETLWQAAKALCCSPESVEKQNAFAAPYAGGERLVNFCKR